MATRYFTVEEANALLPRLTELLLQIQAAQREVQASQKEIRSVLQSASSNGGSRRAGELLSEFERMEHALQEIQDLGCVLKDVEMGLVDFLHKRHGREVYLCWRLGESEIRYWHELQTGFGGRKPL